MSQQIYPPISRLCQYIQGTDNSRLASCLGLDSGKYHTKYTNDGYDCNSNEMTNTFNTSFNSYFGGNNYKSLLKVDGPVIRCSRCSAIYSIDEELLSTGCKCSECGEIPPFSKIVNVHLFVFNYFCVSL